MRGSVRALISLGLSAVAVLTFPAFAQSENDRPRDAFYCDERKLGTWFYCNSEKVKLLDFIDAIEEALGIAADRNYMPMQPGDVAATWADASLLERLTGYRPRTDMRTGVKRLVEWYREFHGL